MPLVLLILILWSASASALPPLRFAITQGWTMPLVRIDGDQPVEGILYDLMREVARQVGREPEFHVIARLRLDSAMASGEVDVRCHAAQAWVNKFSGDYIWSLPLLDQRDVLVARPEHDLPIEPEHLGRQAIGTVLGYDYPTLQPLFDKGRLRRDDARNQALVLQKLVAGRNRYAVSNQMSVDWFNRQLPVEQRLRPVAVLQEQGLGCYVRNDPTLPVQPILRAMFRMKQSGDIDRLVRRYQPEDEGPGKGSADSSR